MSFEVRGVYMMRFSSWKMLVAVCRERLLDNAPSKDCSARSLAAPPTDLIDLSDILSIAYLGPSLVTRVSTVVGVWKGNVAVRTLLHGR